MKKTTTKKKKYYFIKQKNDMLFESVRLSNTVCVSFTYERNYLKTVAFAKKSSATKYIKKYLKPFVDISLLEPVAILVDERDEEKLNVCMFLDIQ